MISDANKQDIRDTLMIDISKLEDEISTDKSTLKLTKREIEILKALPKRVLQQAMKILSKYTPVKSQYDIRREFLLKAVAQMALHAKQLYIAYKRGSDAGEKYNG